MADKVKKSARGEYGLTLADLGKENKNIVVIFPDSGDRYLSTKLFEE